MKNKYSPLRYPGGKTCLYYTVEEIFKINGFKRPSYAEPFAGGFGLGLTVLFEGLVSEVYLNDIDVSIWSFWNNILNNNEKFVEKIRSTKVTIEEWHLQKHVVENSSEYSLFDLGYATFFLNRTNRSGIIRKAGMIGGKSQTGNYKLDCRFNKDNLISRIERIGKYKDRIHLSNLDALDFISMINSKEDEEIFLCIDPPYFKQGSSLYTNFYLPGDHEKLASKILSSEKPWILTYDNAEEIKKLYKERRQFDFSINYSLSKKEKGAEVMITSKALKMTSNLRSGLGISIKK